MYDLFLYNPLPGLASTMYTTIHRSMTYRVLLLLHIQHSAILERPLDNIRLRARSLDPLALIELAPEAAELLELDQVPNGAERCLDDGGLSDRGRSRDARHGCLLCAIEMSLLGLFVR